MTGTKQLEVVRLSGFGNGPVRPTNRYTDAEYANEVLRGQEAIQDPAIVCIEDRRSVGGKKEPVRRKTAGGASISAMMGAVYADWYLLATLQASGRPTYDKGRANEIHDFTARKLVDSGIVLGAHTDSHAHGDKTGCGAADGAPAGNQRITVLGSTKLMPVVATLMGKSFDPTMFEHVVMMAHMLEANQLFAGWDPVAAHATVRQLGGVMEVVDAENQDIEADPQNLRHNHWAEGFNYNTEHGKSNNRDGLIIPYFELDEEAVGVIANPLGRNDYERRVISHGIYTYNAAIAYGLTSDMRFTVTGPQALAA